MLGAFKFCSSTLPKISVNQRAVSEPVNVSNPFQDSDLAKMIKAPPVGVDLVVWKLKKRVPGSLGDL